jgi:hypothetical protein
VAASLSVELYSIQELNYLVGDFFDRALYHLVRDMNRPLWLKLQRIERHYSGLNPHCAAQDELSSPRASPQRQWRKGDRALPFDSIESLLWLSTPHAFSSRRNGARIALCGFSDYLPREMEHHTPPRL